MRGFKAKVLRRIALSVEKDNEPGYVYPRGRTHTKFMKDPVGTGFIKFAVSGQAVLASQADRLYNRMKRDLRVGGS